MSTMLECPRCERQFPRYLGALSRRDNETLICHYCGSAESLEDGGHIEPYDGKPYWEDKGEKVQIKADGAITPNG